MAIIFDGRKFAKEKEDALKSRIKKLKTKPKLVSILLGNDEASVLYTKLKNQASKRVGVKFEVKKFESETASVEKIIAFIKKLNTDKKTQGIMVQLPLPGKLKSKTQGILRAISREKDVDGLTKSSPFTSATVRAIKEVIEYSTKDLPYFGKKAAVIGAKGTVGKAVSEALHKMGYKVCECDKSTRDLYAKLTGVDLIVAATGVPGLVKGEIVKEGVIAIDVGAPIGDFDKSVYQRASFVTPVPGGIGPVTIACLLENLVEAVES